MPKNNNNTNQAQAQAQAQAQTQAKGQTQNRSLPLTQAQNAPTASATTGITRANLDAIIYLHDQLLTAANQIKTEALSSSQHSSITQIIALKQAQLEALKKESNPIYKNGATLLLQFQKETNTNRAKLNKIASECTKVSNQLKTDLKIKQA